MTTPKAQSVRLSPVVAGALLAMFSASFGGNRVASVPFDLHNAELARAVNQPDLVVTAIGWTPATVAPGNAVTFNATVKNQGSLSTSGGTIIGVAFTVDGQTVSWSDNSTASLAPGATRVLTANAGPTGAPTWSATSGTHSIGAWVDDVNRIAESNETNNKLTQSLTVSTGTPPSAGRLYGYSVHLLDQSDPDTYANLAVNGRAKTVREDLSWATTETSRGRYDWTKPDKMMTYASRYGLRELIIVTFSPDWASSSPNDDEFWLFPPANAADYGNFVGQVAARYGTNGTFWTSNPTLTKVVPAGIEIWNEPNTGGSWKSGPDPVKYTAMLKAAYRAAKNVDASLPIIAGALASHGGYRDGNCDGVTDNGRSDGDLNPLNFLEGMYQNGAAGFFDAVSTHPYNFWKDATATQMLAFHVCSAWSQMAETTPSIRSMMAAKGDGGKKLWATELGAPTKTSTSSYVGVTEAEQANLATRQLQLWQSYSWSGNYYWYDLRDDNGGDSNTENEEHFGAVRGNNSAKPAYTSLTNGFVPR